MTTRTRPIADHGTLSRYKHHGCKCDTCRAGYTAWQRNRYRRRGYGTWQPFVDAEPIRQHILTLHAGGMSYASIAKAAGMYEATVTGFIYALSAKDPRKEKATPEIAARILAVTPDPMLSGWVDATGTRRRIQALAANGWPMSALAGFIGVNSGSVNRFTRQIRVYADTARAVADVYAKYATASPQDHGVPQWKSDRHRREAQAKQWPDPTWWEDMGHIDDPTFDPQKVVKRRLNRDELAAIRREEIAHLASYGHEAEEIAQRIGLGVTATRQILLELRTGQRRDRKTAA
ncbi:hypothetical protein [Streptomyces cyaneofuscatus]|uniref:hypothetical protein n=1 Tax=Streptomyces cyaneofuscatus TaxID=66883 RepID=UPI0033B0E6D9